MTIMSKPLSEQGRKNWDAIFPKEKVIVEVLVKETSNNLINALRCLNKRIATNRK